MGIIFDSCIWVGLASDQIPHQAVIDAAGEEPVFTSVITLGELAFGVESCSDPTERAARAASLRQIESRPSLVVTRHTAAAFGVLAAAVKQAGRSPRPRYNDLWIAAQAIENGYALLTINAADFVGLPGLRLLTLRG
ncbi:MAG: PIN domain-containing protein [Rhodocyclaceae bacterium]